MTKRNMMRYAHELAKLLVAHTGDYQIALSFALKEVWRQVKLYDKKRFTKNSIMSAYARLRQPRRNNNTQNVFGVPAWLIRNNLTNAEAYAVLNECYSMKVVRETEKAQLVEFSTNYGKIKMWTPKSVLVA